MIRKLLVVDTSYSYEAIRARGLEDSVTCRDLGGFFSHVWTVHPFASLVSQGKTAPIGPPDVHELSPLHTFIDGKVGRFEALDKLSPVNFLLSQAGILGHLAALIRKENISVIRVGDPLYAGLMGLALARRCKVPLAVRMNANYDNLVAATGHAMMPRFFRTYAVEKKVIRFVLSRADLVAAVNQDNLDFAVANGARREVSTIFPYGNLIDKRHLEAPDKRDLSPAPIRELWPEPVRFLLHVGRLEKAKFPADPIKVLADVRRRGYADLKLIMVGDGTERAALVDLARELGVGDDVAFVGNKDQGWLSRVIPQAAVVLSPLTGRALTEVAFGGAPIVAYDLDWQKEVVTTGETGELVPSEDVAKMAESVARFLADPSYARAMGAAVRRRALERFDPAALDAHERAAYTDLFARFAEQK